MSSPNTLQSPPRRVRVTRRFVLHGLPYEAGEIVQVGGRELMTIVRSGLGKIERPDDAIDVAAQAIVAREG